tara:strand:+ start:65 stop:169 length:105 start_codon:yes stop_codon:yes gene_type:complete
MNEIIVETEANIDEITEALNNAGIYCFIYIKEQD